MSGDFRSDPMGSDALRLTGCDWEGGRQVEDNRASAVQHSTAQQHSERHVLALVWPANQRTQQVSDARSQWAARRKKKRKKKKQLRADPVETHSDRAAVASIASMQR